jgi:hypothetical protein
VDSDSNDVNISGLGLPRYAKMKYVVRYDCSVLDLSVHDEDSLRFSIHGLSFPLDVSNGFRRE